MEIRTVPVAFPDGTNVILGQSHFIKTVEDLYEILATTAPGSKFGIAFAEASGPRLVRHDGNDEEMERAAIEIVSTLGAGHSFAIVMRDAFPISVLRSVANCQEVCRIFCATANPLEAIVAETPQGKGILGVVDGASPKGVEGPGDVATRGEFLRKIGYKR